MARILRDVVCGFAIVTAGALALFVVLPSGRLDIEAVAYAVLFGLIFGVPLGLVFAMFRVLFRSSQ